MFSYCNSRVIILMAVSVVLTSLVTSGNDAVENAWTTKGLAHGDNKSGSAIKCDPADPTLVALSWKPRELSPLGQVEVSVSYKARYDMNGGYINASLYFHGETEPFLGYSNRFLCDDIHSYFDHCPLRKTTTFFFKHNFTNLHPLTSFPGYYDAILDVRNDQNQLMLCVNITVLIQEI